MDVPYSLASIIPYSKQRKNIMKLLEKGIWVKTEKDDEYKNLIKNIDSDDDTCELYLQNKNYTNDFKGEDNETILTTTTEDVTVYLRLFMHKEPDIIYEIKRNISQFSSSQKKMNPISFERHIVHINGYDDVIDFLNDEYELPEEAQYNNDDNFNF